MRTLDEGRTNILARVAVEVRRHRLLAASVSGVIAIVALLLIVIGRHGGPSQSASGVSPAITKAKTLVARTMTFGITTLKQLTKSASVSDDLTKRSTDRRTTRLRRTSKPGRSPATAAPASGASRVGPPDLSEATADLPFAQRALDPSATVLLVPDALGVSSARTATDVAEPRPYTSSDDGVIPPVLWRQQFPTRPPLNLRPEDLGVLELVIDEAGRVESVKLLRSPLNRFHDKMIVAAAKAWQFRPALKDGQPVRFRQSVRITLPN